MRVAALIMPRCSTAISCTNIFSKLSCAWIESATSNARSNDPASFASSSRSRLRGPSGVYFRFVQPGDFFFNDRTEGRLVRSLDHFLENFAEHYTVLEGPYSFWMLSLAIFPLRYATTTIFTGGGVGGAPQFLPVQTDVEQKYVRRYHFLTETSVVGFLDSCQAGNAPPAIYADQLQSNIESCATLYSPLGSKVFNVAASRLRLGDEDTCSHIQSP
jgi:hypothetical protein